jgi:hypothetical protein
VVWFAATKSECKTSFDHRPVFTDLVYHVPVILAGCPRAVVRKLPNPQRSPLLRLGRNKKEETLGIRKRQDLKRDSSYSNELAKQQHVLTSSLAKSLRIDRSKASLRQSPWPSIATTDMPSLCLRRRIPGRIPKRQGKKQPDPGKTPHSQFQDLRLLLGGPTSIFLFRTTTTEQTFTRKFWKPRFLEFKSHTLRHVTHHRMAPA